MSPWAVRLYITIILIGITVMLGLAIGPALPPNGSPPATTTTIEVGPSPADVMWEAAKNRNPWPTTTVNG